ncbi:hypothetical protein KVR01_010646 [Diaporthe batatas]|uniref:uncharacterized protein n=1 Tax=Diaporthe batatas TaxID=748121 RepID=UPI001D058723|nr:uncharacterized protein KVR01_010646 [Diaporthe batatas]KAG8160009.1 hypothetical protein KVR01_010646 [Diaporthe batatas]
MAGSSDNQGNTASRGHADPQASTTSSIPIDHAAADEKGKAPETTADADDTELTDDADDTELTADADERLADAILTILTCEKPGQWDFDVNNDVMKFIPQGKVDIERTLRAYKKARVELMALKPDDQILFPDDVRRIALAITDSSGLELHGRPIHQKEMEEIRSWRQTDVVMISCMVLCSVHKVEQARKTKPRRDRLEDVIEFLKTEKIQVAKLLGEYEHRADKIAGNPWRRLKSTNQARAQNQSRRERGAGTGGSSDQDAAGPSSPVPSSVGTAEGSAKKKQKMG